MCGQLTYSGPLHRKKGGYVSFFYINLNVKKMQNFHSNTYIYI